MAGPVSNAELERVMAEAVDENGGAVVASAHARTLTRPPAVTDEELATALAAAEDEDGVDQRLAAMTAAMTDQERAQAQTSIQRWIDAARRTRESKHAAPNDV